MSCNIRCFMDDCKINTIWKYSFYMKINTARRITVPKNVGNCAGKASRVFLKTNTLPALFTSLFSYITYYSLHV